MRREEASVTYWTKAILSWANRVSLRSYPGGTADQEFRLERTGVHQLNLFDAVFGIALPNDPQPRIALKSGTSPAAGEVHFGDGSVLDIILARFFVSAALKGLKLAGGGDFYVSDAGKGIILKNAAGQCARAKLNAARNGFDFDLLDPCP